jgi:hypothetical protein
MSETREIKTTLAIDGEKQFKAAMDEAYRGMKVLGSEMKLNTAVFGDNASSLEGLTKKGEILGKQISQQKEIVAALSKAVQDSASAYGENDKRTDAYRIKLNNATAALNNMEGELKENSSAIENFGKETQSAGEKTKTWNEKLQALSDGLQSGIDVLKPVSAGIAAIGAAAIAAGKQLFDLTVGTGKWADGLITTSVQTGVSTTALQEWGYAAQFIDTEVETMTGSMAKMIRQLTAAKEGTGASAEAFKTLGVNITDSSGQLLNSQEIFFASIDALGRIANETERDALAMQLFGKSAQELNPLIIAGSDELKRLGQEAQSMGIIMGEEGVSKLGLFDDKMNVFNSTITGMKNNIALALTPAMDKIISVVQGVADKFSQWLNSPAAQTLLTNLTDRIINLADNVGGNLDGVLNGIISAFETIGKVLGFVIENFDTLATIGIVVTTMLTGLKVAQIAVNIAMSTNPIGAVILGITALVSAIVILIRNWDDVKAAVVKAWEGIKTSVMNGVESIKGFFGDLWEWLKNFPSKMLDIGVNIVKGIWEGIKSSATWFWENLKQWFSDALGWIGDLLGIHSPSRVMADKIGKPMVQGVAVGILKNAGLVNDAMESIVPDTSGMLGALGNFDRISGPISVTGKSSLTVSLDDSALDRLASKLADVINLDGAAVVLNDREMGRWVRKVALA